MIPPPPLSSTVEHIGDVVVYLDRIDPQATFGTPVFLRRIVLDALGGV